MWNDIHLWRKDVLSPWVGKPTHAGESAKYIIVLEGVTDPLLGRTWSRIEENPFLHVGEVEFRGTGLSTKGVTFPVSTFLLV